MGIRAIDMNFKGEEEKKGEKRRGMGGQVCYLLSNKNIQKVKAQGINNLSINNLKHQ